MTESLFQGWGIICGPQASLPGLQNLSRAVPPSQVTPLLPRPQQWPAVLPALFECILPCWNLSLSCEGASCLPERRNMHVYRTLWLLCSWGVGYCTPIAPPVWYSLWKVVHEAMWPSGWWNFSTPMSYPLNPPPMVPWLHPLIYRTYWEFISILVQFSPNIHIVLCIFS